MSLTSPSSTSTPSLYLSNWQDLVGIWKAAKLSQLDTSGRGPRLGELHYLRGSLEHRRVNQIVDYTGFFRDETHDVQYTHAENFESEAWFESGADDAGVLTTNYLTYHGAAGQPVIRVSRRFAGPPGQPFFIVKYTLTNPTADAVIFNVLDQVHLNNLDPSRQIHAWYDPDKNAFIADMSASGQPFLVLGTLQPMDGYQAADNGNTDTTTSTVCGWCSFDGDGTLKNNADVRAGDVALAFNKRVDLAAHSTAELFFYLGMCESEVQADAAIATARGRSGEAWLTTTAAAYNGWLASDNRGLRVHFEDDALNQMYDRALILIKNVQNPVIGTFAATTNPLAYEYKNWVRDASTTAIALDASGHHPEAALYWRWMAGRQESDGTWKTTYNTWDGTYVPFVEPEYDSVGAFLVGVYRHYTATADAAFLHEVWPNVKRAADWIIQNIQPNGFGAADYSIWEESDNLEHNTYTQSWYVAGLYATQCLAEALGDTSLTEWYAGGAATILTAMQRPSTWQPSGSWNPLGYYNRAVNIDGTPRPLIDSSSNMLIALGVVDHESGRASSHIATILRTLTKEGYGVARYPGDTFYYTGAWSPGGNEALASEPSWPQMSLWVAVFDILRGAFTMAMPRLKWCAGIFGKGYMACGEVASNVTHQPLPSTMSEPLTASAYVLAALQYEGQTTLRTIPPSYNAGAHKSITVNFESAGDWQQWLNVPYFVAAFPGSDTPWMYALKRVYISNDYSNLYVRIDNASGAFSTFNHTPFFAVHVYSQDFARGDAPASNLGLHGQPLARPMSHLVERRSDTDGYGRWRVDQGQWVPDGAVTEVIEPQWDAASGRFEAVIPLPALSSGSPNFGGWTDLVVALVALNPQGNVNDERSHMLLHYRLSRQDDPWIYGNIEQ